MLSKVLGETANLNVSATSNGNTRFVLRVEYCESTLPQLLVHRCSELEMQRRIDTCPAPDNDSHIGGKGGESLSKREERELARRTALQHRLDREMPIDASELESTSEIERRQLVGSWLRNREQLDEAERARLDAAIGKLSMPTSTTTPIDLAMLDAKSVSALWREWRSDSGLRTLDDVRLCWRHFQPGTMLFEQHAVDCVTLRTSLLSQLDRNVVLIDTPGVTRSALLWRVKHAVTRVARWWRSDVDHKLHITSDVNKGSSDDIITLIVHMKNSYRDFQQVDFDQLQLVGVPNQSVKLSQFKYLVGYAEMSCL